jgi:hypothetical protein
VSCAAFGGNKPDYATIVVPTNTAENDKPDLCCGRVSSLPHC